MAVFQRANGNTGGVFNIGAGRHTANATIINTGIAAPIQAFKITATGGNLAAELGGPNGSGVSGAVETLLNVVAANATVIAYQVDTGSQLSVITERSSDTAATLQAAIRLLSANIGAYSTVDATAAVVSSTGGIKLA